MILNYSEHFDWHFSENTMLNAKIEEMQFSFKYVFPLSSELTYYDYTCHYIFKKICKKNKVRNDVIKSLIEFEIKENFETTIIIPFDKYTSNINIIKYNNIALNKCIRIFKFTENVLKNTPCILPYKLYNAASSILSNQIDNWRRRTLCRLENLDLFFRYVLYFYTSRENMPYDDIIKASIMNVQTIYYGNFRMPDLIPYEDILFPYIIKPRLLINGIPEELCDMLVNLNMYL